jgi:hypothetical protein
MYVYNLNTFLQWNWNVNCFQRRVGSANAADSFGDQSRWILLTCKEKGSKIRVDGIRKERKGT